MLLLALLGLLWIQDPDVDKLLKQLEDESIIERDRAIKALIEAGDKAVPRLKSRMSTADEALRRTCGEIIETIAVPKKLRGVLRPISRVNLDARDQSLREVLVQFQNQTRIPLDLGRANQGDRWPKITVRVDNAAPLEALNAICKAAKYYWHTPESGGFRGRRQEVEEPQESNGGLLEGPALNFAPGNYNKPRVFVRHYQVEVWEIVLYKTSDFQKGKTRGELSFGVSWPAGVRPHSIRFEVTSAVDDQGNELIEGHDDPSYPKGPRRETFWDRNPLGFGHRYRIRYPADAARTIATIRGKATLNYLLGTKSVLFESPGDQVGGRQKIEGTSAELIEYKTEASYVKVRVKTEGNASGDAPRVRALLEDDKFSPYVVGNPVKDELSQFDFYLQGLTSKVKSLEIVVDAVTVEDPVDFEFKDVHLP